MKYVEVVWQDHYSEAGWQDISEVAPQGHVNVSVGVFLREDIMHVTLAQTIFQSEVTCADVLHILKTSIISRRELV